MNTNLSAVKRILAMILLVATLITSVSISFAEDSVYFKNTGKGDKIDLYVRVFVPSSKSPKSSVGHYDLMIKGKLHFAGRSFVNPVFSYRTDGTLEVFSASETSKVYKHKDPSDYYYGTHIYYYHTKVKGANKVYHFISEVGSHVKDVDRHPHSSNAIKCELKGVYSTYKIKYVNCYLAVAKWMEVFGKSAMMNYYNDFYGGKSSNYLPKTFLKRFKGKLKKKI